MSKTARALALATPLLGLTLVAVPAGASDRGGHYEDREVVAHLEPVPGNGVDGEGRAEVEFDHEGRIDEFEVAARGLLADQPHAAHIHFGDQARHECPGRGDDANGDRRLNTSEGVPAYGPVVVSLTTEGDTSPKSVLAI